MFDRTHISRLLLVGGFLAVLVVVPLGQAAVEWYRGVPIQATDLFRRPPTVENLRGFEQSLEDAWWGNRWVRPKMQQALFLATGDTGPKAIRGRAGWLFYRPGVACLCEKDRLEQGNPHSTWVVPPNGETRRNAVAKAIVRFRDQLRERGLGLLVVPVPAKASVYPEMLTRRFEGKHTTVSSPTEALLEEIEAAGVHTVDLFKAFRDARTETSISSEKSALYLATDTHWTPQGAAIAAETVARKLHDLGWVPEHPYEYTKRHIEVRRFGDIAEMTGIPGLPGFYPPQTAVCAQILDPFHGGPLVPPPGDQPGVYMNRHLLDTPMEARFLLLGDSFSRIYQYPEPASLGEVTTTPSPDVGEGPPLPDPSGTKRLLPGSAGFPSLLADALKSPVDYLVSDGGAATEVRRRLSVTPEILDNKKVIIWEFTERDIVLGREGWNEVALPTQ